MLSKMHNVFLFISDLRPFILATASYPPAQTTARHPIVRNGTMGYDLGGWMTFHEHQKRYPIWYTSRDTVPNTAASSPPYTPKCIPHAAINLISPPPIPPQHTAAKRKGIAHRIPAGEPPWCLNREQAAIQRFSQSGTIRWQRSV